MAQHCIKGKRIRRVCIPKEYDIDKIQIGIPVICDEAKKVGLIKNGDVVLPSGIFGAQCRRNASRKAIYSGCRSMYFVLI